MLQLLRRKPIADLMANEGSDWPLIFRVPIVRAVAPLGAIACGVITVGRPPQAWKRLASRPSQLRDV